MMVIEAVDGFDWDSGNRLKSEAKHGLSQEAIEEFFSGRVWVEPDLGHSAAEQRFLAVGLGPKGRPIVVIFTFRLKTGRKLIRPISARFMHAREARKYGEAFAQVEE